MRLGVTAKFSNNGSYVAVNNFTVVDDMSYNYGYDFSADGFMIVGMPTVLSIDSQRNELTRLTGFVNAGEFPSKILTAN